MKNKLEEYFAFIGSEFFNMGPTVSFIWKNDSTWSVQAVSRNIKENFSYQADHFKSGKLVYASLIHKDDLALVMEEVAIASQNKLANFIHKPYRIKNGKDEYRWVKDTTTIMYDEDKNITHFVGYIVDITENKKNLLKAKEHEKKLKIAQTLASIGNWELELETHNIYWSDEIFKLFQIDQTQFEASYETFLNIIHPEDRAFVNDTYLKSLKTKEKYTIQHRLLMDDGAVKYVEQRGESYFHTNGTPYKSIGTIQDITQQKLTELELEKTLSFLQSHQLAMDESSIVSKSDIKGNITYVNDNFCKISGYTKSEALGQPHNIVRDPENPKELFEDLWQTIKAKKVWKKIIKNRNKSGNYYWVDTSILPILDEKKDIVEFIAVRHDVTNMIENQNKLDNIVNTDTLTGLGSRYKLLNDIKSSITPALAIINLDNFSQVNDFFGHEVGDRVIKEFGKKLIDYRCSDHCFIYHLQGDEYVLFDKNIDKDEFIERIVTIEQKLSGVKIAVEEEELSFNFSTAISFEPKENILSSADMALKIAKRENKNLVIYRDEISLNDEYANNIKWSKKIKEAIKNNTIIPVFQAIVNNRNEIWEKYECLVRIQDEEKIIAPYFFLEIAKKTKQYTTITKIMIKKSFEMFHNKDFEFSINLTIEDILNEDITNYIFSMLDSYKIGSKVVFEIVESESIENFEQIVKFVEKIKSYGCKIAIDDFGTGYSNFEYLMKLKADYIKIDGSMIKNIDTSKDAKMVVSTIIDFAQKMGMKTIGEFVENESIQKIVKEMGIDYSQGYYFSKPALTLQ